MSRSLTPLQRIALFKASVTLHRTTMAEAASRFGVSYYHLLLVLKGNRKGSSKLEEDIAKFSATSVNILFESAKENDLRPTHKATLRRKQVS